MGSIENVEKGASNVYQGESYSEENVLLDPPKDQTLHRGLKARQISMIAVGSPTLLERNVT
jgi:amino acid permease